MQHSKSDQSRPKPKAEARQGNIALDVARPLFDEGDLWDFQAHKNDVLKKENVNEIK